MSSSTTTLAIISAKQNSIDLRFAQNASFPAGNDVPDASTAAVVDLANIENGSS
jgi:hypothetical protein